MGYTLKKHEILIWKAGGPVLFEGLGDRTREHTHRSIVILYDNS